MSEVLGDYKYPTEEEAQKSLDHVLGFARSYLLQAHNIANANGLKMNLDMTKEDK